MILIGVISHWRGLVSKDTDSFRCGSLNGVKTVSTRTIDGLYACKPKSKGKGDFEYLICSSYVMRLLQEKETNHT